MTFAPLLKRGVSAVSFGLGGRGDMVKTTWFWKFLERQRAAHLYKIATERLLTVQLNISVKK